MPVLITRTLTQEVKAVWTGREYEKNSLLLLTFVLLPLGATRVSWCILLRAMLVHDLFEQCSWVFVHYQDLCSASLLAVSGLRVHSGKPPLALSSAFEPLAGGSLSRHSAPYRQGGRESVCKNCCKITETLYLF